METEGSISTISAPVSSPGFSAALPSPEISVGGGFSPGFEAGFSGGLRSVTDFGPEHQISPNAFSSDLSVPQPGNVFQENVFGVIAKPMEPLRKVSSLTELFGPQIEVVRPPMEDKPLPQPGKIFDQETFAPLTQSAVLGQEKKVSEKTIFEIIAETPKVEQEVKRATELEIKEEVSKLDEIFGPRVKAIELQTAERPVIKPQEVFREDLFDTEVKIEEALESKKEEVGQVKEIEVVIPESPEVLEGDASQTPDIVPMRVIYSEEMRVVLPQEVGKTSDDQKIEQNDKKVKSPKPAIRKGQILEGASFVQNASTEADHSEEEEEEEKAVQAKKKKLVKGKIEEETPEEVEPQVFTQAETVGQGEDGGTGRVSGGEAEKPKDPEEPKEPVWEVSGKKPETEEVAQKVLERREKVAQEVVETSAKETQLKNETDPYVMLTKVTTRLGQIDTPTFKEALRMIFGKLTFPFVTNEAEREIARLKPQELTPGNVFKSLQKLLHQKPPIQPKEGEMRQDGTLPESKLARTNEEIEKLIRKGAVHIVYDQGKGKWKKVEEKPFRYPVELDKTEKIVPVEIPKPEVIDTRISPWYTLFAQRAEARAKQKKAKS